MSTDQLHESNVIEGWAAWLYHLKELKETAASAINVVANVRLSLASVGLERLARQLDPAIEAWDKASMAYHVAFGDQIPALLDFVRHIASDESSHTNENIGVRARAILAEMEDSCTP